MGAKKEGKKAQSVGARARRKGRNGELEAARVTGGRRTSQTGIASPDIIDQEGRGMEVKRRTKEFRKLYEYLDQTEGVDRLICRDDRMPWLVIMTLDTYKEERGWQ